MRNYEDEFSAPTRDVLAKRVGVRCSNPSCRKLTTGPRSDTSRIINIGVAAHITAAAPGGKRFDISLSSAERSSEANGIWLCQNCAKLVDNDEVRYTVALLRAWKHGAEGSALAEIEGGVRTTVPEDAAELELAVGGRVLGGSRPPLASKHTNDAAGTCIRHDYEFVVTVRNLGNERLNAYHVEIQFPRRPLENPETHPAYVVNRSTRRHAFFRASGASAPEVFPGDAEAVLTLRYYVDDALYWEDERAPEHKTYAQPVRVTLHRPGLPPLTLEKPFEELSNF